MKFPYSSRACVMAWCAVLAMRAHAQPLGTAFTYQGELRVSGTPASGLYDLRFRLYDASAGGAQVGPTLCSNNTSFANGRFTVALDFLAVFAGQQRFLEIDVRVDTGLDCTNAAGFTTLSPRQSVTAAPNALYAINAASAATAINATQLNGQAATFYQNAANLSSGTIPSARLAGTYSGVLSLSNAGNTFSGSGAALVGLSATNVSAGTLADARLSSNVALLNTAQTFTAAKTFSVPPSFSAAGAPFAVASTSLVANLNADRLDGLNSTAFLQSVPIPLTLIGANPNHIIRAENSSTVDDSVAIAGWSSALDGATSGVFGQSDSTAGLGVYGLAAASTGTTYGGYFQSGSSAGRGVYGLASGSTGVTYGGYFQSSGEYGTGVYGLATATSNIGANTFGLRGESAGPRGFGVYGLATHTTGGTFGGYFESMGSAGTGVHARASAATGGTYGVYGQSDSTTGRGVYGRTTSITGGVSYGVYGYVSNSFTGYGVYSQGDLGANGVKSFRIDHPDDPANKYLLHYSAESPEVINFYRGTALLDGAGQAVIQLPAYFAQINKAPSYQLTAVGAPMPMLHIAAKISEADLIAGAAAQPGDPAPICSFRIAGGAPGGEVSWRVEAVRNDLYVQRHGAPVEVQKQGSEIGTYQQPELYGQPPEKGMDWTPPERTPRAPVSDGDRR